MVFNIIHYISILSLINPSGKNAKMGSNKQDLENADYIMKIGQVTIRLKDAGQYYK